MSAFTPISMEDLHKAKASLQNDELILDVRSPEEFADGHVPGAKNIPHHEVALHAQELKKFKKLYVYCHAGGRVQMAAHDLIAQGLSSIYGVVGGGFPDWEAQYPVEK